MFDWPTCAAHGVPTTPLPVSLSGTPVDACKLRLSLYRSGIENAISAGFGKYETADRAVAARMAVSDDDGDHDAPSGPMCPNGIATASTKRAPVACGTNRGRVTGIDVAGVPIVTNS